MTCILQTVAMSTPHRWNYWHWLVITRSLLGGCRSGLGRSFCYCEQCPGASIHLCWACCQRISGLGYILKQNCHLVVKSVVGFLLPFLKWELPIWDIFKLPFSHPVMEICWFPSKWPLFCRQHFHINFLEWKVLYFHMNQSIHWWAKGNVTPGTPLPASGSGPPPQSIG